MREFFKNRRQGMDQVEHLDTVKHNDHANHVDYVNFGEAVARQKYGGMNIGAAFMGWLVSNSVMVLLLALLTALGTTIALTTTNNPNELLNNAEGIGLAGAIGLLATLAVAYYAGGYVAGRMSRFDGARQGLGVWAIGIVMMVVLAATGAILGANYNLLQQLNLPSIPVDGSSLTTGGLLTLLAGIIVSLVAAMAGGKVGTHYQDKVTRTADEATHHFSSSHFAHS